jgi:integrase
MRLTQPKRSYRLTDSSVRQLPVPATGNKAYFDDRLPGFGCRVTAAGYRSFFLNYTSRGRERRFTIGSTVEWKAAAARAEAARLKDQLRVNGADPLAELRAERADPLVSDLCARYEEQHIPKKRYRSGLEDKAMIASYVIPHLGTLRVAEVSFSDVDGLHRKITKRGTPARANRVASLLSKMFSLAKRWGWRTDNPVKGIEKNHEEPRSRYLSGAEIARLTEALAAHPDQQAANVVRLLLLTGARRNEVLTMTWSQLDAEGRVWTKPSAHTKQKKVHRVPLSAPARLLLSELRAGAAEVETYVFPSPTRPGAHRENVKRAWREVCQTAGLEGVRLHDLRHCYASILVSAGNSLPTIGALLGHTQPQTTARYAHLADDPLLAATETAGAIITGQPSAEIKQLKGRR